MRLELQKYDFDLCYVPGKKLQVADALSRNFQKEEDFTKENKNHDQFCKSTKLEEEIADLIWMEDMPITVQTQKSILNAV